MANQIRTIHYGIGFVGAEIARLARQRPGIQMVGAVDVDPAKAGRDLGEVVAGESWGLPIVTSLEHVLSRADADIVIHTTGSHVPQVYSELETLITSGLDVVSTCEELSFPSLRHPDLAGQLDQLARHHGVTVLGTGINPGFLMDRLPLTLTGLCQGVYAVRAVRIVDTARRRVQLQRKTGTGLTVAEFEEKVRAGTIRHVGLPESAAMIAAGLGWHLDELTESIEPVVAEQVQRSEYFEVQPGDVCGVRQVVRGLSGGREVIRLDLEMSLNIESPRDEIVIDGIPPIHMVISDGVHGDRATAAVVVNSIPLVVGAQPGVLTVVDLPAPISQGIH